MKKLIWATTLLVTSFLSLAQAQPAFQEGKDYKLLGSEQSSTQATDKNNVKVIEFFSYGCPACNFFEPTLKKWLKDKPNDIDFARVPVIFHKEWQVYAKAYYIAQALGVADKISPAVFAEIHQQKRSLLKQADMAAFFAKHGVKESDFNDAYQYSTSLNLQINQGNTLMRDYQITGVPAVTVNGRYLTDMSMAKGPERMIAILNFLVENASKAQQKS